MKISTEKKEKISEQILSLLYSLSPQAIYTAHIAKEIARDEEFVMDLLLSLEKKGILVKIKKNPKGEEYYRRNRWKLSDRAYQAYSQKQK
jgi:predicted transcriptional regulator with HTH domain